MKLARPNSALLRSQIEESLAERAPGALTPQVKNEPERIVCGVRAIDERLRGGLPLGAITELVGADCSGRTTTAQAYVAATIQSGSVAAWVDVDDVFDPESAARSGIDCRSLLWVRCTSLREVEASGVVSGPMRVLSTFQASLPAPAGGGGSPHPRSESRTMPQAIETLLAAQPRSSALPMRRRDKSIGTPGVPNRPLPKASIVREEQVPIDRLPSRRGERVVHAIQPPRCAEPQSRDRLRGDECQRQLRQIQPKAASSKARGQRRSWEPLDQALRATDLLLQSGGFSLIVFDLGSTPPERSWRIPLASWFRFRAACERTRTSLLLLTKHPCAKSSAELVVRMETGRMEAQGGVLTGISFGSEVERQRFQRMPDNVVPIRKPPQSERPEVWQTQTTWAL